MLLQDNSNILQNKLSLFMMLQKENSVFVINISAISWRKFYW